MVVDGSSLGDPDGMEALAGRYLLRAESIAGVARSLSRQVQSMEFEGPAADALRNHMEERYRRASRAATELQEAAHLLKRSAATLREQMYELELDRARSRERDR